MLRMLLSAVFMVAMNAMFGGSANPRVNWRSIVSDRYSSKNINSPRTLGTFARLSSSITSTWGRPSCRAAFASRRTSPSTRSNLIAPLSASGRSPSTKLS